MPPTISTVLEEALQLAPNERAALIEQILTSLDSAERQRIDAAWAKEAEDRVDAFERGELNSTPAAEVLQNVQRNKS